ncbi:hypothetical protein [Marispirochaeta aestuarii]|uniref:hypothetical protein n=1 Tax=Marispirochaeta aestuarii TaxID=1963862 RepID=UPI0029C643AB|nr:hypothetical protein [Marispirochaeta aestuarii]
MNIKTLSTTLLLVLVILFLHTGCVTNQSTVENRIEIAAETTPDGIRLAFNEIPSDTTRIFVYISLLNDKPIDGSQMFADIRDSALEQVKKSRTITCPFVQEGSEYSIIAFISTSKDYSVDSDITVNATGIAGGGIRPTNTLSLYLIDKNTGVELSDNPVFSEDVTYDGQKYMYKVTIDIAADRSIGYGEGVIDALSWHFMPSMKEDFVKEGFQDKGTFPAFVTVFSNLVYEDITWSVGIAQTEEFMISL